MHNKNSQILKDVSSFPSSTAAFDAIGWSRLHNITQSNRGRRGRLNGCISGDCPTHTPSAPTRLFLGFISYCRHFNPTYSLSYDYLIAKEIQNTKTWHSTMLLDRGPEILVFEARAQRCKYEAPPCDATPLGFTNPMPQILGGDVAKRTNRIGARSPPTAKSKTKVQIRPDNGKEKAGHGGGRDKGDGYSDDEDRRPGRRGGDDREPREMRATPNNERVYEYFWTWCCVSKPRHDMPDMTDNS
jgi:hypothetical protein